jgi:SAM-dependent methyltransferase
MSNLINSSGSDSLGIANFHKKTGRVEARKFEDDKALSFISSTDFEIKANLAYKHEFCPICANDESVEIFNKDGYHHHRCTACDFIFVNPCLKPEAIIDNVYGNSDYPFFEAVNSESQLSFDRLRFLSVIQVIREKFPEKKSIYDIGCGSGFFLKLCKENGFNHIGGIDALEKAYLYAKDVLKLENISYGDYREVAKSDKKYDVVSMWELLDHVVHPKELLNFAESLLNPEGIIIISVRNGFSLAARVLRERCNMFLGYAHTNFWNNRTFDLIGKQYNLDLLQLKTYISELDAVNNYLQFQDPYVSKTITLDFLPSQEDIINNLHGYKFIAIMQKK